MNNDKNIAKTALKHGIARKQDLSWIKDEEKIQQQKFQCKASGKSCTSKFPLRKKILYDEYKKQEQETKKKSRNDGRFILELSSW